MLQALLGLLTDLASSGMPPRPVSQASMGTGRQTASNAWGKGELAPPSTFKCRLQAVPWLGHIQHWSHTVQQLAMVPETCLQQVFEQSQQHKHPSVCNWHIHGAYHSIAGQ